MNLTRVVTDIFVNLNIWRWTGIPVTRTVCGTQQRVCFTLALSPACCSWYLLRREHSDAAVGKTPADAHLVYVITPGTWLFMALSSVRWGGGLVRQTGAGRLQLRRTVARTAMTKVRRSWCSGSCDVDFCYSMCFTRCEETMSFPIRTLPLPLLLLLLLILLLMEMGPRVTGFSKYWRTNLRVSWGVSWITMIFIHIKGKVIPLQARCGPEGG